MDHLSRLCKEEEETFIHFVNDCPCLRQARQDHFGLNKIEKSHGWTIRGILKYSRIKVIDLALKGEDSSDFSTDWEEKYLTGLDSRCTDWPKAISLPWSHSRWMSRMGQGKYHTIMNLDVLENMFWLVCLYHQI